MNPDAPSELSLDQARESRYQPIMSIDGVFVCGVDRGGWVSDFDFCLYSISNQPALARDCRPLASITVRDDSGYRRARKVTSSIYLMISLCRSHYVDSFSLLALAFVAVQLIAV